MPGKIPYINHRAGLFHCKPSLNKQPRLGTLCKPRPVKSLIEKHEGHHLGWVNSKDCGFHIHICTSEPSTNMYAQIRIYKIYIYINIYIHIYIYICKNTGNIYTVNTYIHTQT